MHHLLLLMQTVLGVFNNEALQDNFSINLSNFPALCSVHIKAYLIYYCIFVSLGSCPVHDSIYLSDKWPYIWLENYLAHSGVNGWTKTVRCRGSMAARQAQIITSPLVCSPLVWGLVFPTCSAVRYCIVKHLHFGLICTPKLCWRVLPKHLLL